MDLRSPLRGSSHYVRAMGTGAIAPEDLAAAGAFVEQTLTEHPDRALSPEVLVGTLRDLERLKGAILDGAAVELARRLARLHRLPLPSFPCEFRADFSGLGDRDLAIIVLRFARQFEAGAADGAWQDAGLLVIGAARLLAADPLILSPARLPARLLSRKSNAGYALPHLRLGL